MNHIEASYNISKKFYLRNIFEIRRKDIIFSILTTKYKSN